MWKYCTTLWLPWGFQKASTNDNAQQCPKILLQKKGFNRRAQSGYHEISPGITKAEMICNVAVQHMQGWRGAITIHDECECDKCMTTQQVLERGWGCD